MTGLIKLFLIVNFLLFCLFLWIATIIKSTKYECESHWMSNDDEFCHGKYFWVQQIKKKWTNWLNWLLHKNEIDCMQVKELFYDWNVVWI